MVATAIVDTGCSKTILNQNFLSKNQHKCLNSTKVVTFEGNVHQCIGSEIMTLEVDGIKVINEVILVDFRPFRVDMMLGMNSIRLLGGVSISPLGKVKFGSSYCGRAVLNKETKDDKQKVNKIEIKKKDQEAVFGVKWRVNRTLNFVCKAIPTATENNVSADKNGASQMDKIYSYPISVKGLRKKNLPAKNDKNKRFRIADKVWLKPPNVKCHTKWQPAIITQNASNQTAEVIGIPRHVKHIRPQNDTRSLYILPDIVIEVGTDTCHGNAENHEEQIEDVLERQEEDVEAESGTQEVNAPSQRSAWKRRMPSKYLNCYLFDP